MGLRCEDVRRILAAGPAGDAEADAAAEHLDQCADCARRLDLELGKALSAFPVREAPSLPAVRKLIDQETRGFSLVRLAAVAAGLLVALATGWAILREAPRAVPAPAVAPEPPKLADLRAIDRNVVQVEGVLALYLQFCLSCINTPTDDDRQEYLTRSLLIFREVRGRIRAQFERESDPAPTVDAVTRDALNDALRLLSTSKLASVSFFPTKVTEFSVEAPDRWRTTHQLGGKSWRLTLHAQPVWLNFAYLKIALGADEALMARLEETLWTGVYVNLPKKIEDGDPTIAAKTLEAVLPLLSSRQQAAFRKIAGSP